MSYEDSTIKTCQFSLFQPEVEALPVVAGSWRGWSKFVAIPHRIQRSHFETLFWRNAFLCSTSTWGDSVIFCNRLLLSRFGGCGRVFLMRISTQNLNGIKNDGQSIFWHGRAWFRKSKNYDDFARAEWQFGKLVQGLSAYVTFGSGEDECGVMFHVCLPFIFSIFITLNFDWIRAKERRLGFAVHNNSFWIYIFDAAMGDCSYKNGKLQSKWY